MEDELNFFDSSDIFSFNGMDYPNCMIVKIFSEAPKWFWKKFMKRGNFPNVCLGKCLLYIFRLVVENDFNVEFANYVLMKCGGAEFYVDGASCVNIDSDYCNVMMYHCGCDEDEVIVYVPRKTVKWYLKECGYVKVQGVYCRSFY